MSNHWPRRPPPAAPSQPSQPSQPSSAEFAEKTLTAARGKALVPKKPALAPARPAASTNNARGVALP